MKLEKVAPTFSSFTVFLGKNDSGLFPPQENE